ncbi:MAG: hypothetical protein ACRDK2_15745 [Solirubrobacteraceae bacterium]
MPVDHLRPDLEVSLEVGPYAPRVARFYVTQVGRPSPDLRDAISLLTSEMVTRAVHQWAAADVLKLREWMSSDVVRVEILASGQPLEVTVDPDDQHYELLLLNQIADRWSVGNGAPSPCMWFEIDHHEAAMQSKPSAVTAH